jgi:hypothetical protein
VVHPASRPNNEGCAILVFPDQCEAGRRPHPGISHGRTRSLYTRLRPSD